jgi:pimeloyl-ACP methyl ester carboxylesterase
MAELIPGSELVLMPGVGHLAPIQQPEAFNRIVLVFLAS